MTITIKPTKGKVLIDPEPYKPADTFLHIPETAMNRDMPCFGKVFAIGARPLTKKGVPVELEYKIGDRVFFPKFVGLWVELYGRKFIQIGQKDVAAIIE